MYYAYSVNNQLSIIEQGIVIVENILKYNLCLIIFILSRGFRDYPEELLVMIVQLW